MMHAPRPSADQDHLILVAAMATHYDRVVAPPPFKPEIAVELPPDLGIGHCKSDVLQRADGHLNLDERGVIRRVG
jgi:hypothetical protein